MSAFAARQRLVLAQTKVNEKSNEIVAIPALLDMLSIEGAIVTIDAMGCQRGIAQKIIDKKADYVLALKGNQGTLRDDAELFATEQKARAFADTTISADQTVDGDTAASKRAASPSSTTSPGGKNDTNGRASEASSSSTPHARRGQRPSAKRAST